MSEQNINDEAPVVKKQRKPRAKKQAVAPQEVVTIENAKPVEEEVVAPTEEVTIEEEVKSPELVNTTPEEIVTPDPTEKYPVEDINKVIIDAVKKYGNNIYLRPGRTSELAGIIKRGGTVGISNFGRIVHLNTLSPEGGGRKVMQTTFKARVIINDLIK